jgi:SWI/SNF-related matrix-associated actin-dependent regulator of chromatin subfamily D
VDDPLEIFTSHLRTSTNQHNPAFVQKLKDIAQLDADIALAVQGMYSSKAKIDFMDQLGNDPVNFVKKWISAQRADEEIILGEEKGRGPEWSRGGPNGIWGSDSVREGVSLVLARGKPVGH